MQAVRVEHLALHAAGCIGYTTEFADHLCGGSRILFEPPRVICLDNAGGNI